MRIIYGRCRLRELSLDGIFDGFSDGLQRRRRGLAPFFSSQAELAATPAILSRVRLQGATDFQEHADELAMLIFPRTQEAFPRLAFLRAASPSHFAVTISGS